MRMKVSNYISEMLVKAGINQAFMVTGGGAMLWMMHWDIRRDFIVFMIIMSRPVPLQQKHMPGSIIKWQLFA